VYTVMVLDEREIGKLDDPIIHGPPDTPGDWGHFVIGGEKLRCREREGRTPGEIHDGDVAFCFHDLAQFPLENPLRNKKWQCRRAEDLAFRQVDFTSIYINRAAALDFIADVARGPSACHFATARIVDDSWDKRINFFADYGLRKQIASFCGRERESC
jgi:hypothetical protein